MIRVSMEIKLFGKNVEMLRNVMWNVVAVLCRWNNITNKELQTPALGHV